MNDEIERIIQIIPVPENLYKKEFLDEENEWVYSPIVCIALTSWSNIRYCDTDDLGYISDFGQGQIVKYDSSLGIYKQLSYYEEVDND
ncbi:hypothetical protein [Staphylococcus pasteuri]|uniref:hypothetical protein n=1 Tax=Staphylococcus pasteuri TaxID=45972 RepID=UPI002DB86FAB|nr:hypothetical protein [Staphylococcus pasteuri]MEB7433325.1 hypothetical protein [Staphylococcus pasteuri]